MSHELGGLCICCVYVYMGLNDGLWLLQCTQEDRGKTQVSAVAVYLVWDGVSCPQLHKTAFLVHKCPVSVSQLTVGIQIIETHSWFGFMWDLGIWTQAITLRQVLCHKAISTPCFHFNWEKRSARKTPWQNRPFRNGKLETSLVFNIGKWELGIWVIFLFL